MATTAEQKPIASLIEGGRYLVPPHMWDAVTNYFVHRYQPGGFLTALLSNDLMGAMGKADDVNASNMHQWCQFLYNYAPSGSYGSPENVRGWLADFGRAAA